MTSSTTETDRGSRALRALLEVSKEMSSEVDLDDLLEVIVRHASSVVEADRTSIFVYDAARNRLWTRVAQGMGSQKIELPMGSGVAGDVARTLQLTNIADAYNDSRFNADTDRRSGYHTRSILSAPVIDSTGKLLGVIQSVNKLTGERFDEQDESIMRALASHVAVAIERARLTEVYLDNERLEQSLKLANEIQMRMLPPGEVALPASGPFAMRAYIRPAKQVGGDFYDFFWDDDRLFFCLGDVSGKGIGSALVMAVTKTLFWASAANQDDPSMVMSAVNERLYEETDETMFVTAFCGFLDLRTGVLRYTSAGHDRPLILSNDAPPRPLECDSGLALAVVRTYRYKVEETILLPGQSLYLYTDGISEATNMSDDLFSVDRIRESLTGLTDPAAVVSTILEKVDGFVEGAAQADDLTMMCIHYRGIDRSGSRVFRRDLAALPEVFEMIGRFVKHAGLDPKLRYPIDFAVEELFTNFVKYNAGTGAGIEVRLAIEGDAVKVIVIDPDTDRFDVNLDAPAVDPAMALDDREPGGLGLYLIKKMMDRVEYKHENRVGTVTLYKRLS